jgi:hypothetical protein
MCTTFFSFQNIRSLIFDNCDKSIIYLWVPAHVGISMSDIADEEAKKATLLQPFNRIEMPLSDFKSLIKKNLQLLWQIEWNNVPETNFLRSITHTTRNFKNIPNISRIFQVKITKLLIGHTKFTHDYLLKRENPPICTSCNIIFDFNHLFHCPVLNLYDLKDLLKTFLVNSHFEDIVQLLRDCNFFDVI